MKIEKYKKATYMNILLFLITSFIAIHTIEKIIDIDGYIETDIIEIEEENTNSDSSNNISSSNSFKNSNNNLTSNSSNNIYSGTNKNIYDSDAYKEVELVKETNIFSNKYFNKKNLVAPGVSGIYKFKIINNRDSDIVYNINTIEDNEYNINLEYRLKCDNKYVISNWVSAEKLVSNDILLQSNKSHLYILEWRWPYESNRDDIDTKIGEKGALYKLKITLVARDL